jgi:hypothetical protein
VTLDAGRVDPPPRRGPPECGSTRRACGAVAPQ